MTFLILLFILFGLLFIFSGFEHTSLRSYAARFIGGG